MTKIGRYLLALLKRRARSTTAAQRSYAAAASGPISDEKRIISRRPWGAVFLCFSAIVLLWTALLYDLKKSEDASLEQGRKDVGNIAVAFRENITGIASAIDQLMIAIAADHARDPDEYRIPDWVEKSPILHGLAVQVGMTGRDGMLQISSLPVQGLVDLSDRPHIRHHLDPSASQPYISVPVLGRVSGKWSVQFTRRLNRIDGSFDGVVIVSVDPFYLSKFFDSIDLGKDGSISVVGQDGIVRARAALTNPELGKDLSKLALFQQIRTASEGTSRTVSAIDGIERVYGYASLQSFPLTVVVGISTEQLFMAVHRQRINYLIFGGIATIAITALALAFIRESERRRRHELALYAQAHVQEQKARLDAALSNMSQGLVMFDSSAHVVLCNQRYINMYGLSADLVKPGCTLGELLHRRVQAGAIFTEGAGQYARELLVAIKEKNITSKITTLQDGRVISVVNCPIPGGGWVATHEDITAAKRAEERIAHVANHDALTGLPNRALFFEELAQALQSLALGKQLAVLYVDLDHLKRVNDTLGHPIGDKLLNAVADRLRGCITDIDTVARLGGDEFAIIQSSPDQPSDAAALAVRLRDAIHAPFDLAGHQIVVDTSIGISIAPNDATEPDQLLKSADIALYEAKNTGRGTYCFYETGMAKRIQVRADLEQDLRNALAKGEFELFYQPVVNLQDNKITAFETLLRWHHPTRGMVSPVEFIPVAEEMGLIVPLGEWVLRTACAEAATWPGDIRVAVNISSLQLRSTNLVNVIISAIASARIPASRLELEITESVFIQNTFANLSTLKKLHELGIKFAMDDFGTGYSSLGYLMSFPFSKIKIDRSFITGLPDKTESRAIVQAIVDLARSLDMSVTAEGVETDQQLEQVRISGCTEMQGHLFSYPLPSAELSQLFSSSRLRAADAA